MFWNRRDRIFLLGAALAFAPALTFLPLFTYLLLAPSHAHFGSASATVTRGLILTGLVFLQMTGSVLVGFASSWGGLRFVALLAVAASLLLLLIACYTGVFIAVFAAPV